MSNVSDLIEHSGFAPVSDRALAIAELRKISAFCDALAVAALNDAANGEDTWEMVYDTVFSEEISRRVYALADKVRGFRYADPDTTYEEDAKAFIDALRYYVSDL